MTQDLHDEDCRYLKTPRPPLLAILNKGKERNQNGKKTERKLEIQARDKNMKAITRNLIMRTMKKKNTERPRP